MANYVNDNFLALISGKTMVLWEPYNVPLVLQTYVLLQQCQILNTTPWKCNTAFSLVLLLTRKHLQYLYFLGHPNSLILFYWKNAISQRIYIAGNDKTCLCYFCPAVMK